MVHFLQHQQLVPWHELKVQQNPTFAPFRFFSSECRDLNSESIKNTSLAYRNLYSVPGLDTETLACPSKKAPCGIFDSIQFGVLNRNLQADISVSFCLTVGPFTGSFFLGGGCESGLAVDPARKLPLTEIKRAAGVFAVPSSEDFLKKSTQRMVWHFASVGAHRQEGN